MGIFKRRKYRISDVRSLPGFGQMLGPTPDADFVGNGVTCGPDWVPIFHVEWIGWRPHVWIEWVCLVVSSLWHDWAYTIGGDERTRLYDDQKFWTNNETCYLVGWQGRCWNRLFYYRLRLWGHFCYTYAYGCEPPRWSPRFWWRRIVGRYRGK